MLYTLLVSAGALVLAVLLLARYASRKLRSKLGKAGVKLSWGSVTSTSVSSIAVVLEQGPLQSLSVKSISWRSAARSRQAHSSDAGDSRSNVSSQLGSAWLPIRIQGVHLVLAAAAKGRSQGSKQRKQSAAGSAARSAAAWPAVSTALAIAKRLLPRIPVQLQDVKVELKCQGLALQLKDAALQWTAHEEQGKLNGTLLLQDFRLSSGTTADDAGASSDSSWQSQSAVASVQLPVAQLSFGVGASRGGPLPVSCTQLSLQMGLLKVAGASQLLLLAAAAAQAAAVPAQQRQPKSGLIDRQPTGQQQQPGQPAGAGPAAGAAATSSYSKVPEQLLKVVAMLPDKVKVGFAGLKLSPPAEAAADASSQALLALPLISGSIGAISVAASSCQRPAAVRTGEKLLSVTIALGPVQLAAAAGWKASSSAAQLGSGRPHAAEFRVKGVTATVDAMKAVDGAGSSSEAAAKRGPLHAGLQQRQQRQQVKGVCSCHILEQVQLQLHAHQVPEFVHSVQLLQHGLQELRQRQQQAAAAAERAAAAAAKPSPDEQERWLPRVGSLSPTVSLSALPRPDTPSLGTPTSSTPHSSMQHPVGSQSPSAAANAPGAAVGPTTSHADGGAAAASPLAAAMQQRLSSMLKGGSTAGDSSLLLEVTATAGAGVSVEVLDSTAAVITWLSTKQLDASVSVEWLPAPSSSSRFSLGHKHKVAAPAAGGIQLAAAGKLQQLAVRVVAPGAAAASAQQAMHQLLLLDAVELRAGSVEGLHISSMDSAAATTGAAAAAASQALLALELTVVVGQLTVAPSSECLQPLLQLAQQAYFVPSKQRSVAKLQPAITSGVCSAPASPSKPEKKRSKLKAVAVAAVDVTMHSMVLTYSAPLPVLAEFAQPAAAEAAVKGVRSQLRAALGPLQLSMQPQQQQLAASLQRLQVGYATTGVSSPSLPVHQSVELLLLQGFEFRHYMRPNLQLLKLATQQVRSDVHIDAALAAAGMADEVLQLLAACAQQLQARHAAAAQTAAAQAAAQAGLLAAAAAVAGNISPSGAAPLTVNPVDQLDPSSVFAAADSPSPARAVARDMAGSPIRLASSVPKPHLSAGLPPMSRSSCTGALPPEQQQKLVLALEARLQDVAVQLSVCDRDVLQVQLELVKYSSVLEQAVLEKLRFSINERPVVQVPHLALHQLPGWLPPGAAAAAAACSMQRSSSPLCGSSLLGDAAGGQQPSHMQQQQQQQHDCSASTESIRYYDDGGVQSWQSIEDAVPSASLGSRRPANPKDPALYQRQLARQQAARERCKVPSAALDSSSSSSSSSHTGTSFGRSNDGAAAASGGVAADTGALIGFEVYAERVLLGIPHDEAPGRIIVVCETWAKAVKPVLASRVQAIKASVSSLKAAKAAVKPSAGCRPSSSLARTAVASKPKPAYLELSVHVQQVVFSLEQHPLETWLGLHGPVLQALAAERHLTEQLLTSCSSVQGRISRTGGSGAAAGSGVVATAAAGGSMQTPGTGGKRWQKRRWGSLGRRCAAVTAAIAAGSITDAAAAAAVGPAAAALSALAPDSSPLHAGVAAAQQFAPLAAGAAAGDEGSHSEVDHMVEAPITPRALETALEAADRAAGAGTPTLEAAAAARQPELDSMTAAAGHLLDGAQAAEADVVSESSDDLDSSETEEAAGLIDSDALAAALPSSAAVLAGGVAGQSGTGSAAMNGQQQSQLQHPGAAGQAAADSGLNEMQQAVLQAHRELFAMYRHRCRPLQAAAHDPYHHSRAVMHVSLARAEAVVLVCLPGHAASAAMAREVVERVDSASQGVLMERFQSISLDVKLQDVVAHFGGVEEMAATVGSVGASGLLIRARQVAAPPQTRPMRMAVGLWHEADAPIVVKGTRPPMKMYTDVKAELDDVQGGFCPGLEAAFGQLSIAFKRLVTPNHLNPDGSVPSSVHPGLPWWDMTGYMWRGGASVRLRGLTAVLANCESPHVGLRDEKLVLTAATLNLGVAAGRIDLTATKMSALAHMAAPDARPGDSLLVLPAFHLPLTTVVFNITTKLPGGRKQLSHHAFPMLAAPPGPDAQPQAVVDVFSMMKCEGWSLGIDIAVNSDRSPSVGNIPGAGSRAASAGIGAAAAAAGSGGAAPPGVAAACWHYYQPYNLPHAFIGEFHLKYIIDAVDTLVNPSAVVRLSRKLKPFHVRDRSPEAAAAAKAVAAVRAQIVAMPLLKQQVEISLTADAFRVHHDAQDSEDPSDMVYIALSSVRYMNTFTYSRFRRTQHLSNGSRLKDAMRQFMASLSVEAYDMKIIKPQGDQLCAMLGGSAAAAAAGSAWGSGAALAAAGAGSPAGGRRGTADHLDRVRQGYGAASNGSSGQGSPSRGSPMKGSRLGNAGGAEEVSDLPGFNQGLIAAAACFLLRQAPADSAAAGAADAQALQPGAMPVDPPPIPKRPIRMIAQDVKLLCPGELRDTCMLLFHHIQKAFSGISFGQPRGPTRISTKKTQQQQQAAGASGSPKASGIARSWSDGSDAAASLSRASTGAASPRVGSLQRHGSSGAEAGSAAGAPPGGHGSNMVSSVFEEELMLQRILQENQAAAEAAAAAAARDRRAGKQRRSRSAGKLAACSISSNGSDAAAEDDGTVSEAGPAAAGAGHAAVAVRAVKGPGATALRAVTVVAGADDESPRSVHSDEGSRASAVSSSSPRAQQQGKEEVLLEYEIEFVQVQVNLVSDNARGSLVLGTNSALLLGHLHPARQERSVSFKMDQVQAHVVCSEGNPQQAPLWLEIANGKLATPAGAEGVMRQVLLPFKCQLVTTKQALDSATAAAVTGGPASSAQSHIQQPLKQQQQGRQVRRSSSSSGLPASGFAASAAQELRLHVPAIGARLDSRQFEVLVDVIQNIAMAPMPTFPAPVRGMCRNPDGISDDDDNQDVQYALETLQSLRERQRSLEAGLAVVLQAHQHHLQQQQQLQYAQLARQQHGRGAAAAAALAAAQEDAAAASCYVEGAHSSAFGAGLAGRGAAAYADIKEASVALLLALAAAGAAGAARSHHQQQLQLRGVQPAHASSSSGSSLTMLAAAGSVSRSGSGPPAGSCSSFPSLMRNQSGGSAATQPGLGSLVLVSERQTVVWWAQEQLQGALDAIAASRVVLQLLRNEAGLLKVRQRDSLGVSLTVDTIDWALSKGSTVIVQGELQGITYQSIRSEDHTGTTKIQLHTATFRDPQQQAAAAAAAAAAEATPRPIGRSSLTSLSQYIHGAGAAAAGAGGAALDGPAAAAVADGSAAGSATSSSLGQPVQCLTPRELGPSAAAAAAAEEAGIILAPWNPDQSWERDELVRIYAIHGALEKRHVVYEHIEVLVHPIRLHLTAALAAALQDYFNLRDEDSKLLPGAGGKGGKAQPEAAAARGAKPAGARDDKRRQTAPGDLAPAVAASGTPGASSSSAAPTSSHTKAAAGTSAGSSAAGASPGAGPLAASASRRPSIFSRRAAAAAAGAAVSPLSAAVSSSANALQLGSAQPQIVVPPLELETASIQSLDASRAGAGFATPVDSPAVDAGGALALGRANDTANMAGECATDAASCYAADGSSGGAAAEGEAAGGWQLAGAATPAPASPGPCVQAVSADAALSMRYGTVLRCRAGRAAAAANTPTTPGSGTSVAGVGPGAFAGGGGAAAAGSSAAGGGGSSVVGSAGVSSTGKTPGSAAGLGLGASGAPLTPGGGAAAAAAGGAVGSGAAANRPVPVRSIKFRHVRFNRVNARVTYEGPLLSISGFGLVLDNRVYRNIDGGWTTVLNRYKWDVIRSLVKSVSGLQSRKLQELQIPTFSTEPPDALELRASGGFRAGLLSLLKGRKPAGGGRLRLHGGDAGSGLDDAEGAGLREGSVGGEDGASTTSGGVLGGGNDYLDLMRDALRAKQKQKKVALLLGNVPPLPPPAVAAAAVLAT